MEYQFSTLWFFFFLAQSKVQYSIKYTADSQPIRNTMNASMHISYAALIYWTYTHSLMVLLRLFSFGLRPIFSSQQSESRSTDIIIKVLRLIGKKSKRTWLCKCCAKLNKKRICNNCDYKYWKLIFFSLQLNRRSHGLVYATIQANHNNVWCYEIVYSGGETALIKVNGFHNLDIR